MKLLPVIKTCYASEKAIKLQIEELFREFFLKGRDEATVSATELSFIYSLTL